MPVRRTSEVPVSLLGRLFSRGGMEHYRRGILLFNQKEYEQAAKEFETALTAISDRNNPYHSLGRFYAAEAHAKLGISLHEQGRLAEARAQFETALDQGYRYPDLHYFLARILEGDARQEEAEQHCREALEINNGYLEARALLAMLGLSLGKPGVVGSSASFPSLILRRSADGRAMLAAA